MIFLKHLKLNTLLSVLGVALNFASPVIAQSTIKNGVLNSPDAKTIIEFALDASKQLVYKMKVDDLSVTNWSRLGLETNGRELARGLTIVSVTKTRHRETFNWALGEDASIKNNYQQLVLHCKSSNASFDVIARAFNGSLAIRYAFRGFNGKLQLTKELTEFVLTGDFKIYKYHEESVFTPVQLSALTGSCDLPATLVLANKMYLNIGEAENRNYSKCVLIKGEQPNSLALDFYRDTIYRNKVISSLKYDDQVYFTDSLVTPWRTISCAKNAIGLHAFSKLNLKLVTPLTKENPVHVKPGKVFRVPISTQGGINGVDFAAKMNFQYIMLDAGWYGAEFRSTSNPTQPIPGLDLPEIISHAAKKGIGVILYVNYVGLRAKLDTILPLYKKWGVSGLKFGFVDGGTQRGLTWLDSAMQKVNDYGFVLNVHDHYKPTGLSRRYPYNLSQEGIRGDENSPDAFHNMILPYTRYLAGPADFTFCYPNKTNSFAKNLKVSKGQQLALTVVYFDPLQAIFWYGKAEDYDVNDADLEFFKHVPTVWDRSVYLAGEIGESVSVARKKGDVWYMGNATGLTPWQESIALNFLDKKEPYSATIYEDDGAGRIAIRTITVTAASRLKLYLKEKTGQAIIFRKK